MKREFRMKQRILALLLVAALLCVVIYLVVDLLYAVVDPNIRLGGDK